MAVIHKKGWRLWRHGNAKSVEIILSAINQESGQYGFAVHCAIRRSGGEPGIIPRHNLTQEQHLGIKERRAFILVLPQSLRKECRV
jgi:hypothetical protein